MRERQELFGDDGLWEYLGEEDGLAVQDVCWLLEQCNGCSLLLVVAREFQAGKVRLPGLAEEEFSI